MTRDYRFLISWRWLGLTLLGLALVATCVGLGIWQHDRYEQRAATNERIETAAADDTPAKASEVLSEDAEPGDDTLWTKVEATGEFDADAQILIRNRSVDGQNGYEVVTPLLLSDGTALLVDRGWVPPADSGATEAPKVPAPPEGSVTVTGRVRPSESPLGSVEKVSGTIQARSIDVDRISKHLDGPVLRGYITQDDPAKGFTAIPVPTQRAWQNFAYAYQWWLFAGMIPVGLVMIARREAGGGKPTSRRPSTVAAV
ncbi:SURF1 family protein [Stackebrandtia nassauensis]|uniref:SURF1-like protein n=1 Tax=Stackebrandtia nassauensis (strain DSM 44728 / CIP 108903 / NRRL B-16338 / NBRC 102104 / LLR-40K-21) TaxID=446470 RepID=D3Q6R5_STANL|nr:SURF1 family protein [Stackebrandtia nassauensis]ADD44308.1 conserved hypothetical protein [Stackebrandtia nassauensis DSM 44728]